MTTEIRAMTPAIPLLVLAAVPWGQSGSSDEPVKSLRARVEERRDGTERFVFDSIAAHRSAEALDALGECLELLEERAAFERAFDALRLYRSVPDLEQLAIELVLARTRSRDPALRRAAVVGLGPFADTVRRELTDIAREHPDAECQSLATGILARASSVPVTPDGLELLLSRFRIPVSGSRDEAVALFARFDAPWALDAFAAALMRAEVYEDTKVAVVEAVGSMRADGVDGFLRRVIGERRRGSALFGRPVFSPFGEELPREAAVLAAAVEALARRGAIEPGEELEELRGSASPDVRRAATFALGAANVDPCAVVRDLLELARSEDVATREGAAGALAESPCPLAEEALYAFLRDPVDSVRFEAYHGLGLRRSTASIVRLIERLGSEDAHMAWAPAWELRLLTGENRGVSARRWRDWWERAARTFEMPTRDEALKREYAGRERTRSASFYGLTVAGDDVVLVLDASLSMLEPVQRASTLTRHDVVRRQLVHLLGNYSHGHRFNIIFFDGDLHPWMPRLTALDEATRTDALRFVWRRDTRAGTSIYDALDLALQDPDVRSIYLLSDGEPTSGAVVSVPAILREMRTRTRYRTVRVHGISVGRNQRLLRGLAEMTGGDLVTAD